jgi:hypothetical protein
MKTNKLLTPFAFLMMFSIFMIACDDDEIPKSELLKTSVQFASKQDTIAEDGQEISIKINFSRPASTDGILKVKVGTDISAHFTTQPLAIIGAITLHVNKNDNAATFKLRPNDNLVADGNKLATFRILEVSEGFISGLQTSFALTIQDDETPVPADDSYANFIESNVKLRENDNSGQTVQIHISEHTTVTGTITIQAESPTGVYGTDYLTEPTSSNGRLELIVPPGTNVVSFKVLAVDNSFISGHFQIGFRISETNGNIRKGTALTENIEITDDELEGIPMGYETNSGNWGMKKTYEYNSEGNVSKAFWQTFTPYSTTGVDYYFYNDAEELIKMNTGSSEKLFYWDNGKIVKETRLNSSGEVSSYIEYGYDDGGNVGSYRSFYLQPDGSYALSDITLLLYHMDGNLYKKIVYYPTFPQEELVISETTFENYIDAENPFPMIEILPTVKTQKKLPRTYRLKTNGHDLLYDLSYEFRPDGKVGKRTATLNGSIADNAVYHYY